MKTITSKISSKKLIGDVFADIMSGLFIGIGINMFTSANNIVPGAVVGLSTFLNYFLDLPIGTGMLLINIPLLIAAYFFLGKGFTISTLRTVFIQTTILDYAFSWVIPYTANTMMAALFGGVFVGIGYGIILLRGSSSGGSDIAGRLLQKAAPHLSMGKTLLIFDGTVLIMSMFVFGNIEVVMLGAITIFMSSKMIDTILLGVDSGVMTFIITDNSVEVCKEIYNQMGRGTTLIKSVGSYEMTDKYMVFCAVRQSQSAKLKKIVYSVDPNAFVVASEAYEVLGRGFNPIAVK